MMISALFVAFIVGIALGFCLRVPRSWKYNDPDRNEILLRMGNIMGNPPDPKQPSVWLVLFWVVFLAFAITYTFVLGF